MPLRRLAGQDEDAIAGRDASGAEQPGPPGGAVGDVAECNVTYVPGAVAEPNREPLAVLPLDHVAGEVESAWRSHGPSLENHVVPVVRIRALAQPATDVRAVCIAVANSLAAELGEEPRGTWATWETVDAYAEGGVAPAEQPRDTHPPIATILAGARPPDVVARMLRAVGDTLVRELGLEPGNVFVTLEEVDPDRLYDASG
jgi:phenylpyruvate tautomerase PptA (4-oxalocrotonate tautomerase family)